MVKQIIKTSELPESPFYSHAVKAGGFVYLSGFVGINPRTKKIEADTIEAQTQQAIQNCEIVLRTAGSKLEDVVQVIVLLRDPADFDAMNKAYSKYFRKDPPARAVAKLGVKLPNVKVSIMMTARANES
jgi:2-iminobutanoate/2-iminopropanoate deaminase